MFTPTDNRYYFKYLVTGITGKGIECVYLPPIPPESEVLFKKEQKFVREEPSPQLKQWMEEMLEERELDPNYIHPQQDIITSWEDKEWERSTNGVWIWLKGEKTFIPGSYYKFLTAWQPYFGWPDFRIADLEIWYWIKFWEEDPEAYGGSLNTIRRGGKSTTMGFWGFDRTSTNFDHFMGSQGEDNTKISDFYHQMILDPFYRLPYYYKPIYDTNTLQKKGILFRDPPRRGKKKILKRGTVLNSRIEYRTSEAGKYDQAVLHSYVMEEPGKTLACNVDQRWRTVKPCLRRGKFIRGKAFLGTTCEFMDVVDKGGRAYKKLCYESDYNIKGKDGRTRSGLYAALMPGDCILEGFIDEWGFPQRDAARQWILDERDAVKDNPKDYSELVRKYALNWNEFFYINAERCEFNVTILQDRVAELQGTVGTLVRRYNLSWENGVRFSRVVMSDDPNNGFLKLAWVPEKETLNNVGTRTESGKNFYYPKNDSLFASGVDPIDHGVVVQTQIKGDEFTSYRRSRPVMLVKRRYDSSIDGIMSQEMLEQRARQKYPYKTGKYFAMMDNRPNDPNVFFERGLMICWLLGVSVNIENQKPGMINWFKNAGCGDFIMNKYVPIANRTSMADLQTDGTPASKMIIQEYTGLLATDVEYFGHTYPFIELPQDLLQFSPLNTTEFDYSVSMGNTELAILMRSKIVAPSLVNIEDFMPTFDRYGNVTN